MERKKIAFISTLHFFVDLYAVFLGIYLVIAGLDPAIAAFISSTASIFSNITQPFLGYLIDRIRGKLPIFIGMVVGSALMSMIGITTNYLVLFVFIFFGKMGISLFHPAGSNIASAAGLKRKERSFSIFITVGTIGFSLSHPYFSFITQLVGTQNSYVLAIPGIIMAFIYLFFSNIEVTGPEEIIKIKPALKLISAKIKPILLLFFIMIFRHGFMMSLGFFSAKMFSDWGFPRSVYSFANTFYSISCALGVFLSGYIAHKYKATALLRISLFGFLPFFGLLIFFGENGFIIPAYIFLGFTGLLLQLSHVSNITMGHTLLPEMTSTVSGILMGFAWSIGELGQPLSALSSKIFPITTGISSGLIVLIAFPMIAAILSVSLRKYE